MAHRKYFSTDDHQSEPTDSDAINEQLSVNLQTHCRKSSNLRQMICILTRRMVLPFSYRLIQVVLEKRPLNVCSSLITVVPYYLAIQPLLSAPLARGVVGGGRLNP